MSVDTPVNSPVGFNVSAGSTGRVDIVFKTAASYRRRVRIRKADGDKDIYMTEYPGGLDRTKSDALPAADPPSAQTYNLYVEAITPQSDGKWVPCQGKYTKLEPTLKQIRWEDN